MRKQTNKQTPKHALHMPEERNNIQVQGIDHNCNDVIKKDAPTIMDNKYVEEGPL